jgi:hypothetical protein
MDAAGTMFAKGERYRLPSGRTVEVMGDQRTDYVACRYVQRGQLVPNGFENRNSVTLTQWFLAAFGVRA